jgi:hypothetical protein
LWKTWLSHWKWVKPRGFLPLPCLFVSISGDANCSIYFFVVRHHQDQRVRCAGQGAENKKVWPRLLPTRRAKRKGSPDLPTCLSGLALNELLEFMGLVLAVPSALPITQDATVEPYGPNSADEQFNKARCNTKLLDCKHLWSYWHEVTCK